MITYLRTDSSASGWDNLARSVARTDWMSDIRASGFHRRLSKSVGFGICRVFGHPEVHGILDDVEWTTFRFLERLANVNAEDTHQCDLDASDEENSYEQTCPSNDLRAEQHRPAKENNSNHKCDKRHHTTNTRNDY